MKKKKKPTISVLLPVGPGANQRWLKQAIKSIEKQTFKNFELLIGRDDKGEGVTKNLIKLARKAKGEFLARMDADDISEPNRLKTQVEYLKKHPRTKLVGSWATLIDEKGKKIRVQKTPVSWHEIKKQIFGRNPLIHPSWMMRRSWYEKVGGYDSKFPIAQDWELISRRTWTDQIENIPQSLIKLRIHQQSVSFRDNRQQVLYNLKIQWGMIVRGNVSKSKVAYLFPKFFSLFIPLKIKLNFRKKFINRGWPARNRYAQSVADGPPLSYKQQDVLGVVLPMGQSKKLLKKSGQWSLWEQELPEFEKKFAKVELFEYRYSDWRRFIEAIKMPIDQRERFKRCSVVKAVHLTGAIPCLISKLLYRIPDLLSYGYRYDEFAVVERKWFQWLLTKLLTSIVIRAADVVMVPTEELKRYVEKYGPRRVGVVPNGVDTRLFKPLSYKGLSLSDKNSFRILFVGRLERQKNLKVLIKALANLIDDKSINLLKPMEIKLMLMGSGDQEEELRGLAKRLGVDLKIKQPVSHDKLVGVYQSADIFVLPSILEGHPKVLLEAMSCGLACLAADIPGPRDIITDGKDGLLVKPIAEGLASGLTKLIEDPQARKRLGRKARKTVVEGFDKKRLMKREIKLLKQVSI